MNRKNITSKKRNPGRSSPKARVPRVLVELGQAVEIHIKTPSENVYYEFAARDKFVLACDTAGKRLFIFPRMGAIPTEDTEQTEALCQGEELREAFTGFVVDRIDEIPMKAIALKASGRCLHIVYDSDKWGRTVKSYIHTFKVSPLVKVDNIDAPSFVVISGGEIRITKEGIIG